LSFPSHSETQCQENAAYSQHHRCLEVYGSNGGRCGLPRRAEALEGFAISDARMEGRQPILETDDPLIQVSLVIPSDSS